MLAGATIRVRQWWLLVVVLVVAVLTVLAGLGLRNSYVLADHEPPLPTAVPSGTAKPAVEEPGSPKVELTADVADYPGAQEIQTMLQRHFDAINQRNYEAWRSTVTQARLKVTPASDWHNDFQSTKDGSILVRRIDPAPGNGLRVLLTLTSTQSPDRGAVDLKVGCIRWRVVYPLARENGSLRIDKGLPHSAIYEPC